MKLMRVLCGLSLGVMLFAATGCGQKTVVVPTDEEARKRAEPQPPPPVSFGGGAQKTNNPAGQEKSPLKVMGVGGGGETKTGENK